MRVPSILGSIMIVCALAHSQIASEQHVSQSSSPSVYLTFEKVGPRKPLFRTEGRQGVWLRLHNNTLRSIFLYADLDAGSAMERQLFPTLTAKFAKDGTEVRACYDVEAIPTRISRTTRDSSGHLKAETEIPHRGAAPAASPYTSCNWGISFNRSSRLPWLGPGESVVFSVPQDYLAAGLRISTMYSYNWEADENGYIKHTEPVHLVYYTHNQFKLEQKK